jgi:hypothetical protein
VLRPFELEPECAKCGAYIEEIFYTNDVEFIESRQRNVARGLSEALVLPCPRCGYQDAMLTMDRS